ncbi:molybdopterin-dependent oxidoreductase [Sinomonas mesophila]|uniref:molybdopterin-dependent oxidoreductase n=1 Tax=Sinomonas mesophila TaxID=1531955 RepID=UPI000985810B|nr:molybdopterin-dependent oxidoreductase [Sinomonas mesophila]
MAASHPSSGPGSAPRAGPHAATPRTQGTPARPGAWAALTGLVAAFAGVLAGELVAAFASPSLSPVTAVGGAVVDFAPPAAKDWAVAVFGTGDKAFLVASIGILLALLGAAAGVAELRRPGVGVALAGAIGAVGLAAVATRALATPGAWACALAAGAVAMALVRWLVGRLRREAQAGPPASGPPVRGALPRRGFLRALTGTAAAVALGGAVAAVVRAAAVRATAARDALRLPAPAGPAEAVPAGADLGVPGVAPLVTPNPDFYRIDTALVVPSVEPAGWTLTVTGLVERPLTLTWDELLAQPLVARHVTLACVSNPVGGDLVGNALWLGWPVRELLARAGPLPGADMVLSRSVDGFTASTPLEALTDPGRDALLAVGMNGEPLPPEHGFPARLVVPGLYGFVSATKWVSELKVTTFAEDLAYWSTRGWSERGPIKTASRIDTPRQGARVAAGTVAVGGVAWAQHRGITAVELRVDDGAWQPARLGAGISTDTWYQWASEVKLDPGTHRITVRAADETGAFQTDRTAPPAPDGATGHHTITIEAT